MRCICTLVSGVVVAALWLCLESHASPANDNFADRTVLSGTNITVQGNNAGASTEPGEDTCGGPFMCLDSVWYAWTAPTNGFLYLSGSPSPSTADFFMWIRAFRGATVDALSPAAASTPDFGIAVTPGDVLIIKVATLYYPFNQEGGGTGDFTLDLTLQTPAPASANDSFSNRVDITGPSYHFEGSIYGATTEPGEPFPSGGSQTLWWRFLPADDCKLELAITAEPTTLTVYEGATFDAMIPVNPLSGSTYLLHGGKEYSVQMASGFVPAGGVALDGWVYAATNDAFSGATQLIGTNVTFLGNLAGATLEPNEPLLPATNTVWVSWTAPYTGRTHFSLAPTYNEYWAVYTGSSVDQLQPVYTVGSGYNTYSFLAVAGTVYHFQFAGGVNDFTFSLSVDPLGLCSNDNFADALLLKGEACSIDAASVVGATLEMGEPLRMDGIPEKSLWWQWQAPRTGLANFNAGASLVTNVVLACYLGDSLGNLRLVGKGTNNLFQPVTAAQVYYFAAAVETNAVGDILGLLRLLQPSAALRIIPGNLLQEPSWEGTGVLGAQYWHWSGDLGGYVDEGGGVDGTTWPELAAGAMIWQDIPTVPGHRYAIQFACAFDGCCGDSHVQVSWDGSPVGVADLPASEGFWHWPQFTATASNATSRVAFQNLARNLMMDAFSVVDLSAPPTIVNPPSSLTTVSGGTAAFTVGATGGSPLNYQWFFNNALLTGATNWLLLLSPVTVGQAGSYFVAITNSFGAVTSSPVTLVVDAPPQPTIVWQPYGDTVAPAAYFSLNVAAIGNQPLTYQWFFNGANLLGATNRVLTFTSVAASNAGVYQVVVQNAVGTAWSLPATLRVGATVPGGGEVQFVNKMICGVSGQDAPVYDVDGVTRLAGSAFLAQLYAGPSLALLRPASKPVIFRSSANAGYVNSQVVTFANVAPGSNAVVQMRAWDAAMGDTYEAARALGGKFGASALLGLTAGGDPWLPQCMAGLQSFQLHAGLPQFTVGVIEMVERQPHDTVVWSLTGQAGFRYLIEKAGHDFIWQPFVVITNVTGTATFTDTASSGSAVTFYRARSLD